MGIFQTPGFGALGSFEAGNDLPHQIRPCGHRFCILAGKQMEDVGLVRVRWRFTIVIETEVTVSLFESTLAIIIGDPELDGVCQASRSEGLRPRDKSRITL